MSAGLSSPFTVFHYHKNTAKYHKIFQSLYIPALHHCKGLRLPCNMQPKTNVQTHLSMQTTSVEYLLVELYPVLGVSLTMADTTRHTLFGLSAMETL